MVAALLWMVVTIWNSPPATLGEAAMREAVRRQRMAPATRVINDQTLGPAPVQVVPPTVDDPVEATAPPAAAASAAGAEAKAPAPQEVKDAAWWGTRMKTARDAVSRDRLLLAALESRVAALANDIAARDDPAQRAVLMDARQASLEELDRIKKQIDTGVLGIAAIQEEARKAGVPAGWVR